MSDALPTADRLKAFLRADLKAMQSHSYSADDIFACLRAYHDRREKYKNAIHTFASFMTPECEAIHSIRYRTKDYFHLADKLRRKCLRKSKCIRAQDLFHPAQGVTDLGGVRILHLYKDQWRLVHDRLNSSPLMGCTIQERIPYIRADEDENAYLSDDPKIGFTREEIEKGREEPKENYTSLHYIVACPFKWEDREETLYFECQVRTLFEEGWAEINHERRYPHGASEIVSVQLDILNRATGIADRLATSFASMDRLPLFVPWEAELAYERAAKQVFVLSMRLEWAARNHKTLIKQLRQSDTKYRYFVPKDRTDEKLRENIKKVRRSTRRAGFSDRVDIVEVKREQVGGLRLLGDVLLLLDTINPRSCLEEPMVVMGTPLQGVLREGERLDILLNDRDQVTWLREFFESLAL